MKLYYYQYLPFFDTITLGLCFAIIMPTTIMLVVPGPIELILSLITPAKFILNYLSHKNKNILSYVKTLVQLQILNY